MSMAADENTLYRLLAEGGAFSSSVPSTSVLLTATTHLRDSVFQGLRRRLLDHEYEVVVVDFEIEAESEQQMQANTIQFNTTLVAAILQDAVNATVFFTIEPKNSITTSDIAYGAVETVLSGLHIDNLVYDTASFQWVFDIRFNAQIPNTLSSVYTSKNTQNMADTFYISKHPCVLDTSLCCMSKYARDYNAGPAFENAVEEHIDNCTSGLSTQIDSVDLFNASALNTQILGTFMADFNQSSSVHQTFPGSPDQMTLRIGRMDLYRNLSFTEQYTDVTNYRFTVGITYFTLLPAKNSVYASVSQTNVWVAETDALTFATTTAQDYSFVSYVSLSIHSTKYLSSQFNLYNMQFARVFFVLPHNVRQNIRSGLIPLNSIRFSLAKITATEEEKVWINPCMSSNGQGGLVAQTPSSSRFRRVFAACFLT